MEYADNTGVEFRLDEVIELLREISGKLDELNSKLELVNRDPCIKFKAKARC